jgi:hypothetical protein
MRLITDVLRDIRKGRVVDAASEELAELVKAVQETGKPGALNLKLTITPQGKGDNAVIVGADISVKLPRAPLPDALFFADIDGDLLRDDPTQSRMFGDAVDPKTGEILDRKGAG